MPNTPASSTPSGQFRPAYISLPLEEIRHRAHHAVASLATCRACPRDCGANRLEDKWGACKTGRFAVVNSFFPHHGEEDCLRGWRGSGTIFFSHCNLRCVFCQNYDISQGIRPGSANRGSTPEELAGMMLALQHEGCHNINLVTPEHVVPQVIEALVEAINRGLNLPIVYNTSAYDSLESLALLDGIVDIYMPDLKLWSPAESRKYLKAADYPQVALEAIRLMHDQVGSLALSINGLAMRGVLIRHLVLPGMLDNTRKILEWIATELGSDSYVNLMDQYHPAGKVSDARFSELNRRLSLDEYREALSIATDLGLRIDGRR